LAVSGAIFLILEMYMPFTGLIQISSAPLRSALAHLGR
jgi:membrane-bound ClpP family serine protease